MDTPMLRDLYRKLQTMAMQAAPFEYSKTHFNEDVKQELRLRGLTETPKNFVLAAEAVHRHMVFISDEYSEWTAERDAHLENDYMGYDTLAERDMDRM